MLANISEGGSTKECVGDGVDKNVGIGMPVKAYRVFNLNAAEDELSAGDEPVHIIAKSYPH